jgi:hypothetical protein
MQLTHSLKAPGDPTLEPIQRRNWFHKVCFFKCNLCRYTLDANKQLCKEQHIQAFPTLRVYRAGSLHPVDAAATEEKKKPPNTLATENAAAAAAAAKDAEAVAATPATPATPAKPPQLQFEAYHGRGAVQAESS